ncbi:unnamed protein product [Paramecium sonneborni]|uniref:Uncharacterized protein n=1 Tax=Paramecium sonneborni TaxID=65129 RepID=A0A8S1PAZ0_9CILI|nr:unnamed protein product [Paramecium sonneborni]
MLSCQKEQMYQSTFSDMTKSRNNLSQLQGQSTLNLSKFKVKQIQLQEIVAKEEEIDNSKLQNNILDTSFPLQIRADIMEMIQKQNLQVQFKQQEDQERLD